MSDAILSGRVDDLEDRVTSLEGQILALPTNADLAAYTTLINGRLNVLEQSDSSQAADIDLLIQNFANLKDTILNIDTILSTHTGLSTGDGVHGHI